MFKKNLFFTLLVVSVSIFASNACYAIPALQLGEGSAGDWLYDEGTQTWMTTSTEFTFNATANDDVDGNGKYAWDEAGAGTQTAYMIFAGVPGINVTDGFDITVENDGGVLSLLTSGFGSPPIEDPNNAAHGIYDSYFEIYEFNFDGGVTSISDTQPGETGTGNGFIEAFDITINSLDDLITGVHMDLFTTKGDGIYNLGIPADNQLVSTFAPFSHDAGYAVPEPSSLALLLLGVLGLVQVRRSIS